MKNRSIKIGCIILFLILILFISLIWQDFKTQDDKGTINIENSNWNIKLLDYSYLFSVNLTTEEILKLKDNKYNLYFLDEHNNLIYIVENISNVISETDDGIFSLQVLYDISNLNKVLIAKSKNKVKYNKNLTNGTKYIGITTSPNPTTKKTTTAPTVIINPIQTD